MARTQIEVETLHSYTIKDLIYMKENHNSKYSRSILSAVIMRFKVLRQMKYLKYLINLTLQYLNI